MVTSVRWILLAFATTNLMLAFALAQSDADDVSRQAQSRSEAKTIAYWVEQLGHDLYLRREMASTKLTEAGPAAIDDLVEAIRSGDLEVVERAMGVITEIALAHPFR